MMIERLQAIAATVSRIRRDGWQNAITGLGTARDKTTGGQFFLEGRIPDEELSAMFHQEDLSRRIVKVRPEEMLREGFSVVIKDDAELAETINEDLLTRDITEHVKKAAIWGKCFGGCLILVGADDGMTSDMPLNEANIKSIKYLTVLDKRYCYPVTWYQDIESPKFMQPETYTLVTIFGNVLSNVHESRVVRFGGVLTDERRKRENQGWDYSILQTCYNVLRDFEANWRGTNNLISDASQAVFKIKGLINSLATPGGAQAMQTRMSLIDLTRSVARAIILDADHGEEFTRSSTTFTGLPDILALCNQRLAAAAEMPVSILMGQNTGGLNNSGESEFRWFYDSIKSERNTALTPQLRRIITLIMLSKDGPTKGVVPEGWDIKYPPMWQMTEAEEAAMDKVVADKDKIYIDSEVWLPEEVALARARGGRSAPVEIDLQAREKMLKKEVDYAVSQAGTAPATLPGQASEGVGGAPEGGGGPNDATGIGDSPGPTGEDPSKDLP